MIELVFPISLVLLPLPLLVWWLVPPHRTRIRALRVPFFRSIIESAGSQARAGSAVLQRSRFQMFLAILVWGLVVCALARPERVGEPIVIEKAARDVMLSIDISGSMDEADFLDANGARLQRLQAVKQVVGEFIAARDGDRVGLIIFGSAAYVQAPFTEDLKSVQELLEQTKVGMAGPHTVIGDAIGLGIHTFESSDIDQRLMILLSDGADTGSRMSPVNAAEIAARNGVRIFTIGVGDPDASGDDKVDLKALMDIASRADGKFYYAGDENALREIYTEIDALVPRKVDTITHQPRESLGHFPLILAALLSIFGVLLLSARKTRAGAT